MVFGGPRGPSRALAAAIMWVSPAQASGTAVTHVIELFTSQGCSSCPPADRQLAARARDPRTVAVSFPVDYWDYIGWKDTFASPLFTARQNAYAKARGDRLVYTPQVVVDGRAAEVGSDQAAIDRDTAGDHAEALNVPVTLVENGGYLHIAIGEGQGGASVYVLRVLRSHTVAIDRGSNSGHTVTYTNVVRAMNKIGTWTGRPAAFDVLELKGDDEGYVVLLQTGEPSRPGSILAAAKTAGL